jgi:hypothetical protein
MDNIIESKTVCGFEHPIYPPKGQMLKDIQTCLLSIITLKSVIDFKLFVEC